ncbi:MAG: PASTA domain-containing protein, partial [Oscillospiraceae bacterium]|nr:PASTA domain-containing protein [Oscillospiraceae bacterium]
ISPEQAKGGHTDNRSDIYSLSVVMYEMMAGRPPYDGESPVAVAIQHINGGAAMPSTLNPNIPGGLEQIIMRAMAHEPSGRYATATQMLADLDEFRKDPAILFDYNIPPTDDVMKFPKPQEEKPPHKESDAEQAARRKSGEGRTPVRRNGTTPPRRPTPPRKKADDEDEKSKKITTIAIISCAVVMVIAIAIFMVVLLGSDPNVEVPNFIGRNYEQLQVDEYDFTIKVSKEYNKDHAAGVIIGQSIPGGNEIVKGGTLYITVSMGVKDEPVYMPDLQGMSEAVALQELQKLPLNLNVGVEKQSNATVEIGHVITTNPSAEALLTDNQDITIYVSEGTAITESFMPDVVGLEEEVAKRILNSQNLNLDIQVTREYNNDVEKGLVISTDPEQQTELKKSQKVTLIVSMGAKKMPMPSLVNMTVSSAYGVLLNAGFDMQKVTYDYVHNEAARDTVLSQSVPEMTEVAVNTEIVLTVSKGPEQVVTKTKSVTLSIPAGMEECVITITDNAGATVATETAAGGASQVTLSLTGSGKQTYRVEFAAGGEIKYETLEVNFDE